MTTLKGILKHTKVLASITKSYLMKRYKYNFHPL